MPTPSFTLKSLTLRAFRSVVKEQTLPLPSSGMHLLTGPSGAGKTTVGEAVAFALGYSSISANALQSWDWLTDETLRDTLEVETVKGTMRVTRGKTASVLMPGEAKARTSAKAVSEGVALALGIDPEFLKVLTYRGQKTPGLFLSMTDAGKKSFLTQLLDLGKFEKAIEQSMATSNALNSQVETARTKLQTLQSVVPPPPESVYLEDLAPYQQAVSDAEKELVRVAGVFEQTKVASVEMSKRKSAAAQAVKSAWAPKVAAAKDAVAQVPATDTTAIREEEAKLQQEMAQAQRGHQAAVALLEKERRAQEDLTAGLKAVANRKPEHTKKRDGLVAERERLLAGTCFTCFRAWPDDPHKAAAIEKLDRAIVELERQLQQCEDAERNIPMMERESQGVGERLAAAKAIDPVPPEKVERVRALLGLMGAAKSERDAKVAQATAEYHRVKGEADRACMEADAMTPEEEAFSRTVADLQTAVSGINGKVTQAKQSLAQAQQRNAFAEREFESAAARRKQALVTVGDAAGALTVVVAQWKQEQDFLGMVRGFLSYIFDETLARIADTTNARLALIPNVSNVTLRFASERETGTGKLRQEITAVCEKNGHVIPIKDGISGGMYTAVELAVDLSLADVIADRTGVYPGWLILDEAFEGLDAPAKAACFEMLKVISSDRAVFVVDHSEDMKELFDSRISAIFDGERTTLVLQ